ncbi:hypothetical protein ES703_53016 [subsurface metagenome]
MIMAVQQKVKTRKKKHECPPHHFLINSENVGHCKYCPEVRDFGRLLEKQGVFVAAGRRGSKARKEVLGEKRARSAAAEKMWQNPGYRAKQSAAMKGRPHKKKEVLV